ncbi:shikimate dehydrogenase [Halalkalibacter krulwichiae]|uniref:Shikimate dehydrogenase (NADP(+)) n=1 Tax=Halalkalibacter krulwichiae TaxID=199441 RepID=A0A1X9M9K7_9BACI|nr:shikimate dehydrogenase [Halalkalibacter krulwichiae]ARK29290.1 Shikimate dehydrogenase [Halalkalibacter krulwichiae]
MEKVFGILGHPVGHSMSPIIHNDAFEKIGIEARYHAFDVDPDQVKEAIEGIRALKITGCNVTVPHKIAVMKYLDEIDSEAEQIGAVNTIVNQNGKLVGYNTDGRGYVKSLLDETSIDLANMKVLVIGAGGGARGIITALLRQGIGHLTITNRTISKAELLIDLAATFDTPAEALEKQVVEEKLNEFDVIINTTSVGMSPNVDESPLSLDRLKEETIVSDLIYNPLETKLLKEAKAKGAQTLNGIGMFVNQAALSFEHWTGQKPDEIQMRKIVLQQLGGPSC